MNGAILFILSCVFVALLPKKWYDTIMLSMLTTTILLWFLGVIK